MAFAILFLASGCTKKDTSPSNSNISNNVKEELPAPEETNSNFFKKYVESWHGQLYELPESEKEFLSHVVDYWRGNAYTRDFVVTDDGSVYHLSFDKKFSNGTHHMKVETEIKFAKVFYQYFVGYDNNIYWYDYEIKNFRRMDLSTLCYEGGNSPFVDVDGLAGENMLNLFVSDDYRKRYKVKENNIYSCNDNKLLYSFPKDEVIERAYDGTIKTNRGYYQAGEVRIVSDYADIEDTFEFKVIPYSFAFDYEYIKFEQNRASIIISDNYIFIAHLA